MVRPQGYDKVKRCAHLKCFGKQNSYLMRWWCTMFRSKKQWEATKNLNQHLTTQAKQGFCNKVWTREWWLTRDLQLLSSKSWSWRQDCFLLFFLQIMLWFMAYVSIWSFYNINKLIIHAKQNFCQNPRLYLVRYIVRKTSKFKQIHDNCFYC